MPPCDCAEAFLCRDVRYWCDTETETKTAPAKGSGLLIWLSGSGYSHSIVAGGFDEIS